MAYAKGGQSKITVTEPDGGRRTFFLIHDNTSSHEAEIPVDVPPGGHMSINDDGSVGVYDANGDLQGTVAAAWAYDVNGDPVPTDYEVRDGRLIQKVYADEATAYPILADPPAKKVKAPASMTSSTSPQKPQSSGNTNTGNTSGGTTSAPNSMTPRTTPQEPPTTGLWDSAWGFGESVVETAVESVDTLGDAWRNFLVAPVNDAAVDPFGLHPGLRAEPSRALARAFPG
ncbi:hypothetical protein R3Q08_30905 [Rhodococcus erythropolis]|uniref:hypothetical protein n=1 Tax=Rhodococcus erythropolis TaxID=1833 RepID=UPI002948D898|nr:hypothetical protein [Rhodococcus erythropolis]MDV6212674.1 hypothetical protein [Rhodococcus erythropolis]